MFNNPFTPVFGGKPNFFFGRTNILDRFDRALRDKGSEDRTLFVTGARGCGKTALLEQLSLTASAKGWRTIDINSENALNTLARRLVRHDSATTTINPEVEVSVLGSGAKIGGYSPSNTTSYSGDDIEVTFLEACAKEKKGLFVSIDEIQKIPLQDLSMICGAFQMASRKGHDTILAIAGLPYMHDEVIHYEGCTYMRRSVHEELGVFSPQEAHETLAQVLAAVDGISVEPHVLNKLVRASYGHPYIIQLLGYYLVNHLNEAGVKRGQTVGDTAAHTAIDAALYAFERRALSPMVDELSTQELVYLQAMAHAIKPDRTVNSSDVSNSMGKSSNQTSMVRESLLKQGLIVSPARGKLMFNVPYLQQYLLKDRETSKPAQLAAQWGF